MQRHTEITRPLHITSRQPNYIKVLDKDLRDLLFLDVVVATIWAVSVDSRNQIALDNPETDVGPHSCLPPLFGIGAWEFGISLKGSIVGVPAKTSQNVLRTAY